MRWARRLLALAVVLVVAVGVHLTRDGGYVTHPKTEKRSQWASAPAWTRPCLWRGPGFWRARDCGAVRGKVVYVQRQDPDGDGDLHLVLVSGLHVRLVKTTRAYRPPRAPRLGSEVAAVGWVASGSHGRSEVYATQLCPITARGAGCAATRALAAAG